MSLEEGGGKCADTVYVCASRAAFCVLSPQAPESTLTASRQQGLCRSAVYSFSTSCFCFHRSLASLENTVPAYSGHVDSHRVQTQGAWDSCSGSRVRAASQTAEGTARVSRHRVAGMVASSLLRPTRQRIPVQDGPPGGQCCPIGLWRGLLTPWRSQSTDSPFSAAFPREALARLFAGLEAGGAGVSPAHTEQCLPRAIA